MTAIKIKRKLESDTLHIPELRPLIGRDVEITVQETQATGLDQVDPQAFWKSKTIDELAKEHGVKPLTTLASPVASAFTPEDFEGFEEAIEQWRKEGR